MRNFLALLVLPLLLGGCSGSPQQDTRFTSIIDGKSYLEFMIPRDRSVIASSSQMLRITHNEAAETVFREVLSTGSNEVLELTRAYRDWTNAIYPMDINSSPIPLTNLDGLPEADATDAYLDAIIQHHEESIAASDYAKKTASGSLLGTLADTIIARHMKELEDLKRLLPQ